MLPGEYVVQSLDHPERVAFVVLDGYAAGRVAREDIMKYVGIYWARRGHAPSVREIAAGVGLAFSTANYHLTLLERAGRVRQAPGLPRSLRLVTT